MPRRWEFSFVSGQPLLYHVQHNLIRYLLLCCVQYKPITVVRFVIAGTIEERILKLQVGGRVCPCGCFYVPLEVFACGTACCPPCHLMACTEQERDPTCGSSSDAYI